MAAGNILAEVLVIIRAEMGELLAKLRSAPAEAKAAGDATGAAFEQGVTKGVAGASAAVAGLKKELATVPPAAAQATGGGGTAAIAAGAEKQIATRRAEIAALRSKFEKEGMSDIQAAAAAAKAMSGPDVAGPARIESFRKNYAETEALRLKAEKAGQAPLVTQFAGQQTAMLATAAQMGISREAITGLKEEEAALIGVAGAHKEAGKAATEHGMSLEHIGRQALFLRRGLLAVAAVVALVTERFHEAQKAELGVRLAERMRSLSGALGAVHAAASEEEARNQLVQGFTNPRSILELGYSGAGLLFKQSGGAIAAQSVRATAAAEKLYGQFQLPQETATTEAKLLQIRAQAAELDARKARTMPEFRAASAEEARLLAEGNKQQQEAVRIKADQARQEMESLKVSSGPLQEQLAALELKRAGLTAGGPRTIMQATPRGPQEVTISAQATAGLLKSLDEEIAKQRALIDANNEKSKIAAGILFLAEREQAILRATLGVEQERSRLAKNQEEIRRETAHQAFGVGMGRVPLQGEMAFQRGAMIDPRRTTEEQEAAEHALLDTRKRYAEDYVKHQQSLGVSTQTEQLTLAKGFLAETVKGSQAWYDSVQKVGEVYTAIRDQARGVAQEMLGLAGAELSRLDRARELTRSLREQDKALADQFQKMATMRDDREQSRREADAKDRAIIARGGEPEHLTDRQQREKEVDAAQKRIYQRAQEANEQEEADKRARAAMREKAAEDKQRQEAKQEAGTLGLTDVSGFMDQARRRDEALLRGERGTPGEIGGALGRQDFWRTVDREGLSPTEAFSRAGEDPHKQLARQLASAVPAGAEPNRGISVDWTGQAAWTPPAYNPMTKQITPLETSVASSPVARGAADRVVSGGVTSAEPVGTGASAAATFGASVGTFSSAVDIFARTAGVSRTVPSAPPSGSSATGPTGATGLPSYQTGGLVEQTGPAFVHKGETVVPASQLFRLPSYDVGGVVAETGPAIVHKGEIVVPADAAAQRTPSAAPLTDDQRMAQRQASYTPEQRQALKEGRIDWAAPLSEENRNAMRRAFAGGESEQASVPPGVTVDWTGRADWKGPAYTPMTEHIAALEKSTPPSAVGGASTAATRPPIARPELNTPAPAGGGPNQSMAPAAAAATAQMGQFSNAFTGLMERFEAGIAHMKADVERVAQALANMLNDQHRTNYGRR